MAFEQLMADAALKKEKDKDVKKDKKHHGSKDKTEKADAKVMP